jgi:hypothetical protein
MDPISESVALSVGKACKGEIKKHKCHIAFINVISKVSKLSKVFRSIVIVLPGAFCWVLKSM